MDSIKIGKFITELRKNAELTQEETGEKLGVSNKTVSKWECGNGLPDITIIPALAKLFGVTTDEILAGERVNSEPAINGSQPAEFSEEHIKNFKEHITPFLYGSWPVINCIAVCAVVFLSIYTYFDGRPEWLNILYFGANTYIFIKWAEVYNAIGLIRKSSIIKLFPSFIEKADKMIKLMGAALFFLVYSLSMNMLIILNHVMPLPPALIFGLPFGAAFICLSLYAVRLKT